MPKTILIISEFLLFLSGLRGGMDMDKLCLSMVFEYPHGSGMCHTDKQSLSVPPCNQRHNGTHRNFRVYYCAIHSPAKTSNASLSCNLTRSNASILLPKRLIPCAIVISYARPAIFTPPPLLYCTSTLISFLHNE